jgi:hypothetical protein
MVDCMSSSCSVMSVCHDESGCVWVTVSNAGTDKRGELCPSLPMQEVCLVLSCGNRTSNTSHWVHSPSRPSKPTMPSGCRHKIVVPLTRGGWDKLDIGLHLIQSILDSHKVWDSHCTDIVAPYFAWESQPHISFLRLGWWNRKSNFGLLKAAAINIHSLILESMRSRADLCWSSSKVHFALLHDSTLDLQLHCLGQGDSVKSHKSLILTLLLLTHGALGGYPS